MAKRSEIIGTGFKEERRYFGSRLRQARRSRKSGAIGRALFELFSVYARYSMVAEATNLAEETIAAAGFLYGTLVAENVLTWLQDPVLALKIVESIQALCSGDPVADARFRLDCIVIRAECEAALGYRRRLVKSLNEFASAVTVLSVSSRRMAGLFVGLNERDQMQCSWEPILLKEVGRLSLEGYRGEDTSEEIARVDAVIRNLESKGKHGAKT